MPEKITRAYTYENSARHLLVKGEQDYVVCRQEILSTINHPSIDTMEAIGGTSDTLTGIVSALIGSGMAIPKACELAARVNRLAGYHAGPTPASQVIEIVSHIPRALKKTLEKKK